MADTKSHLKRNVAIGVIVVLLLGFGFWMLIPGAIVPPTPAAGNSTWTLIDYTTREVVGDFVEISVYIDDQDIDETSDIYSLTNFDEVVTSDDAEDVSLDLTDVKYAWVEIEPDGEEVYSNNFHLYIGGANFDYTIEVYHLASNISMTNINRGNMSLFGCSCNLTDCTQIGGDIYPGSWCNGNYTMALDVPLWTTGAPHCDDHWDMEHCPPDMDEPDEEDWLITYNERSHRCEAPLYNPANDDSKEYESHLEQITEAFALKITFNGTINCTDGSGYQVNMTIMDELYSEPIEIVSCGDSIYVIFYDPINFNPKLYSFSYEILFGDTITWSDIEAGRLTIPKGAKACPIGTFTSLNSICQCD